jgi:copper resistance protein B
MRAALLLALAPLAFGAPALAAGMDPSMPGMSRPMPAPKPVKPSAKSAHGHKPRRRTKHARPSVSASSAGAAHNVAAMPGMAMRPGQAGMAGMPGMAMPATGSSGSSAATPQARPVGSSGGQGMAGMAGMNGMDMSSKPAALPADEEPVGNEPPPPPVTDHAADRMFDPAAMAAARAELRREHGGGTTSLVMLNLTEYQAASSSGGYRWDGEASFGGDINRLFVKSEGEGSSRQGVDAAEVQALYSRAVSPYFDLQAGVRQDIRPSPGRTYATVGFEGLAPYWFEISSAAFLSTHGELLGRFEGYEDFRITQRWILQPRAEVNLAAQDIPQLGIGAGVSNVELGLRLRYEIRREVAPYVGVSFDRKVGDTAEFARARGERVGGPSLVAGIRTWF